ncbi:MAG TPA: NifB/NifX family molybdenum-iron cluster-binding protein [Syntrophales bacterium]|nr:NifB/NifX family molybdenum-iron cluster-binding protein [Syntrophales bacterium]HOX93795.1 NifB/NifX family molybdenum-iron cluster-binding protein [Syntrophales bacterium]HPI56133.1 NifB/NifX family molybdenum-iron cluster-binding protein [Syntrophales bacterium]HPN23977.1 NifB/NifX family molybdenum-iron cluster-binding protein [Syntrophales bacterium]HQM28256.1 NifB/NifX family molybdenum-iron cluster-binding protein [Syntrophales bacterium]
MKIAISTDGEFVSAHFGRCPAFTIVEIENGRIRDTQTIANPGHQPGFIPRFLHERGVSCILAGGMGPRASGFFEELGMQAIVGVSGKIDNVLDQLLKGTLRGGESLCKPGAGKGYGMEKSICDHAGEEGHHHDSGEVKE